MLRNLLPAVAGLALALLVVLVGAVLLSLSPPAAQEPKPTARSYEALVGSAAVHMAGAQHLVHSADHLKDQAREAHLKAAQLELQLRDLLKTESARDEVASKETAIARDLGNKARAQAMKAGTMKAARAQALKAAQIKRRAYLKDERLAAEDKEQAKHLLDRERELFEKSFSRINTEASSQERITSEVKELRHLKAEQHSTQDKLAVLEQRKREMLHKEAEAKEAEAKREAKAKAYKALGLNEDAHQEIKKGIKRPLWGKRQWPSYYHNTLASKNAFRADAPTKPPKMLDSGDDDASIVTAKQQAHYMIPPQRCDLDHPCNPEQKQAARVAELMREEEALKAEGARVQGLRSQEVSKTEKAFGRSMESVLKKFQGDVDRLAEPMKAMSSKLENQMAKPPAAQPQQKYIVEPGMLDDGAKELVGDMQKELSTVEEQMRDDEAEKSKVLERELEEMAEAMKDTKHDRESANTEKFMKVAEKREEDVQKAMEEAREETQKKLGVMQQEIEAFARSQEAEEQRVTGEAAQYAASEAKAFEQAEVKMRSARQAAKQALQAERVKASAKTQERVTSAIKAVQNAAERGMVVFKDKLEGERNEVEGLRSEVAKLQERQKEDGVVRSAEKRVKAKMQGQMRKLVHEDHDREEKMMGQLLREKKKEVQLIRDQSNRKAKEAMEEQRLRDSQAFNSEKAELEAQKQLSSKYKTEALSANRMLAEENQALAHSKKIEAEMLTEAKEARRAAEEAHKDAALKQSAPLAPKPARANPLEPPVAPPAPKVAKLDLKEFQTAVSSQVKSQIRGFERREEAKEHKAVARAERRAEAKTEGLEAKLSKVEGDLHQEEARRMRHRENILGSLATAGGDDSLHLAPRAPRPEAKATVHEALRPQALRPQASEPRAEHRRRRGVRGQEAGEQDADPKAMAEAKALGFGSVSQFEHHLKHARHEDMFNNLLGLGGSSSEGMSESSAPRGARANYMRLEDDMVRASQTHSPKSKGFFNSGLVADNVVPVLSAQPDSQATL